jgi:hypothetical protein
MLEVGVTEQRCSNAPYVRGLGWQPKKSVFGEVQKKEKNSSNLNFDNLRFKSKERVAAIGPKFQLILLAKK